VNRFGGGRRWGAGWFPEWVWFRRCCLVLRDRIESLMWCMCAVDVNRRGGGLSWCRWVAGVAGVAGVAWVARGAVNRLGGGARCFNCFF
jgi:hypothetical protein